ncbi:MAG TPA: HipA domain-containing protein, partial [Demequina sp.]|nr:HipA domain-containing protein [Demequina sp.]
MPALHVWYRGAIAGEFVREGSAVSLRYDSGYVGPPLSLSLPKEGQPAEKAAGHYLDNLLPDNPRVRNRWARELRVPSSPFDILGHMGEDLAGAFSIVPEGQGPDSRRGALVAISEDELHHRAASIQNDQDLWLPTDQIGKVRMSLAGAQGKFSLVSVGDMWFFSTISSPSTHIFKPAAKRFPELASLEAASLAIASTVGVRAPMAEAADLGSPRGTFVVERFDRTTDPSTGRTVRVHAEDMAQAHGRRPADKYAIPARDVVSMLGRHARDKDAPYEFVEMLALNVAIGNADAHGKNYSVMIEDDGKAVLAPIYDTVPTAYYPELNTRLGMKVGRAHDGRNVQVGDWQKFAADARLDTERVVEVARRIHEGVAEVAHGEYKAAGVTGAALERMDAIVAERTQILRPIGRSGSTSNRARGARPHSFEGKAETGASTECSARTA